uniref:Uncharacterized protein n=1 Tax=Amphora coffeiformis TaxID=265554 RepID=A0A7S3LDI3_9STRA
MAAMKRMEILQYEKHQVRTTIFALRNEMRAMEGTHKPKTALAVKTAKEKAEQDILAAKKARDQKIAAVEQEFALIVDKTTLEVRNCEDADEEQAQKIEETEIDISRYNRLLDDINGRMNAVERELEGLEVNPKAEIPEVENYARFGLDIAEVADMKSIDGVDSLTGLTSMEIKAIVADLKKGYFMNNADFVQYWSEQSLDWQKRFGDGRNPKKPYLKTTNCYHSEWICRVLAYFNLPLVEDI